MTDRFNLAAARLNAGMSQRQLAQKAKVGLDTVRRLERGAGAHPEKAKRIADIFGVQVTDLMPLASGEGPTPEARAA